jgi:hypothetical protein
MNSLVIILGILLIFLIYLLYIYLTSTSSTLTTIADFSLAIPAVTGDNLKSATNLSYAYGIWIYVQNWDPSAQKTILYRPDNFKLYLDKKSPTLYCDIVMSNSTTTSPSVKTITLTNSFPIQKWVYIILSMDNQYLDCYLDGKLILSNQVTTTIGTGNTTTVVTPMQPKDSTKSQLYLGNSGDPVGGTFNPSTDSNTGSGWSAQALTLTRWTVAVDPQTAWNWYMKGNGKSRFSAIFSSYGVNYTVLKDNVPVLSNQTLF